MISARRSSRCDVSKSSEKTAYSASLIRNRVDSPHSSVTSEGSATARSPISLWIVSEYVTLVVPALQTTTSAWACSRSSSQRLSATTIAPNALQEGLGGARAKSAPLQPLHTKGALQVSPGLLASARPGGIDNAGTPMKSPQSPQPTASMMAPRPVGPSRMATAPDSALSIFPEYICQSVLPGTASPREMR